MHETLETLKQRYFTLQSPAEDPAREVYMVCFDFLCCGWLGSEQVKGVEEATATALRYLYNALDSTEGPYLEAIEERDQQERVYWQEYRQCLYMKIGIFIDLQRRLTQAKRET